MKEKLRSKVTYIERTYMPKSLSQHVKRRFCGSRRSYNSLLSKLRKSFRFNIESVYENHNGFESTQANKPKSYLFVFNNGDHAIINEEGNVVTYMPSKHLDGKNMPFERCACRKCNKKREN